MPARAVATLEEDADGRVFLQVLTRERLGTYEVVPGHAWEPEEYLRNACTFHVSQGFPGERDFWLVELRVAFSATELVNRYLDLTADSEERRLLGLLADDEDPRAVWPNEGLDFPLFSTPEENDRWQRTLAEVVERSGNLGKATMREAIAEDRWQNSPSWRPGLARPRKRIPRTASPPERRIRYFAARSGQLPRSGKSQIAGVSLPRGRRGSAPYSLYWCSDQATRRVAALASRLATAFPETGLWPLLWGWPYDDREAYLGAGDLDSIDGLDAAEVLAQGWSRSPPQPDWVDPLGADFPGLAEATHARALGASFDPFAPLLEHRGEHRAFALMLVSCNRPADAITAIGLDLREDEPVPISAVLRSWEERFGAIVVAAEPRLVTLSVEAPPRTLERALRIAAELYALAPEEDAGRPGALRELARRLCDQGAGRVWQLVFGLR